MVTDMDHKNGGKKRIKENKIQANERGRPAPTWLHACELQEIVTSYTQKIDM